MAADPALSREAAELLLPGPETMRVMNEVRGHEADIVPVQRIFAAGIAEADPDLHVRHLA